MFIVILLNMLYIVTVGEGMRSDGFVVSVIVKMYLN